MSEQVRAALLGELINDGLHRLRAIATRHEDRVGGQRNGHVGHAHEGDEGSRTVLREGTEDCRAIRFNAQRLAQVARLRDNAGQGLEVTQVRPAQLSVGGNDGRT